MNSDGKLTVTDLSLLIRKIEKTVDYEADLFSAMEQFLEGGQTVETEHMEKIGVLKDMPEVEGFLAEELTDTAQMKVSFTLKDERCYTKAQIIAPAKKGNGGNIGGPNTGSPYIEYSLSMSSGAGYRIAGFDVLDNVKEVYEYSGSGSVTNITQDNQADVKETDAVYDRGFYEDTLKFDGDIWKLDGLAYGKLPSIKGAPIEENNLGISGYSPIVNHAGYDPARERAYANMAKLMPLSDTRMWVEYGRVSGHPSKTHRRSGCVL